jgi:hypothetical protein
MAGKAKPANLKNAEKPVRGKNGGVRPNSGRKSKAAMLGLVALLDANWPEDKRAISVKRLSELAEQGNIEAIKLLYAYAFGKPKETKEHGGIDGAATTLNRRRSRWIWCCAAWSVGRYRSDEITVLIGRSLSAGRRDEP